MGLDFVPTATTGLTPKRTAPLGDIRIVEGETRPLGGLNPYSPHFADIGRQFHGLLVAHAGLRRTTNVLDVGCGTGRLAAPLMGFLTGRYHGFDVNEHFIDHCRKTYVAPNFSFSAHDVRHDEYNPDGKLDPLTFEFPHPDNSFDLVAAVAVFNHFRPEWIERYLTEVVRVLRHKGLLFCTMFLLNQQSIEFVDARLRPPYQFSHRTAESWHDFETRPLFNVGHPEQAVRRMFMKAGLMIREPIRYGQWCESKIALAGPDVLIAQRH